MLSSHFLWSLNMKICFMIKTSTYPLSSGNIFQTMKGGKLFSQVLQGYLDVRGVIQRTIIS
jgi:hypothetical protein